MNKYFKWSLALLVITAAGCSDDQEPKTPEITPGTSGDEVVFTFGDPKSRTTYAEPWAETGNQGIYWGNYTAGKAEQIAIFCRETENSMAKYNVVVPETASSEATSVTKVDPKVALKWNQPGNYTFGAFYPADKMAGFEGEEGLVIKASIENGQVPPQYKTRLRNADASTSLEVKTLDEIAANDFDTSKDPVIVFGMPDMESAIMMAKREVTTEDFGKQVPLEFNVLADVLDITINGPVTPNTLGGNATTENPKGISNKYIKIQSVDIVAKNNETLAGDFTLDITTGDVKPVTSVSTIQISTADNGQYPTLHIRYENDDNNAIKPTDVDQLRLRAFIMPGQIKNLNQLKIKINTNCGEYEQDLDASEIVSGAIHPIKLGYFKARGANFDFSRWIGQLDRNIYLSELSIPGAWHAANPNNQGDASKDLKTLYNAGIRAFEVTTKNGTDPTKYNDFDADFDASTAEYYDEKINLNESNIAKVVDTNTGTITTEGTGVVGRNVTITATKKSTYQLKPKFSLRLYRTYNTAVTGSFSDALITLANEMNPDGLMFFEFGMTGEQNLYVNCKSVSSTSTCTWTEAEIKGNVVGTDYSWDLSNVNPPADAEWKETEENVDYTQQMLIYGAEGWAIAVESCLNRLANTTNIKTGKTVLYTNPVTSNTTIGDVQGQVIVKVNTNHADKDENNNEISGWSGNTPALFSRWIASDNPQTINLKWGGPIYPTPLLTGDADLHWCFTEQEYVFKNQTNARIQTIQKFAETSHSNYLEGLHRTFYEIGIGGCITETGNNVTGCQELAKVLNPALLNVLTNPTRKASPFGLVLMNYAIAPDENEYKSSELIRTIINNNAAFLLQRRGSEATPAVEEKTNSSFNANPSSPIK